ncbi:hypothetical protein HMPREF1421_00838 [Helicobacter pylori GAM265BSii]|uniref:Uncharacterized protein n=1 Tax=Helicobacter pylori GAM265BSii TaxID=1159049 RepID=M3R7J1_HELPX|nr:hypothetical protein HMPREF1421_00838 [Helicobacter pylori GAM265BSii]
MKGLKKRERFTLLIFYSIKRSVNLGIMARKICIKFYWNG